MYIKIVYNKIVSRINKNRGRIKMYTITDIDFDYYCKIIFCEKNGKEFEITCSDDFGEKFYKKYVLLPNKKYPKEAYTVDISFIDSNITMYFKKRFSSLLLYWLRFRGYLSLVIEELFN